jgi:hypothetical protein
MPTILMRMLAYTEPGAGSMILQALAGGVAGAMVAGKLYWRRVKRVLRIGRRESPADEPRGALAIVFYQ